MNWTIRTRNNAAHPAKGFSAESNLQPFEPGFSWAGPGRTMWGQPIGNVTDKETCIDK